MLRFLLVFSSLAAGGKAFDTLEFIANALNSTRIGGVTTCEIQLIRLVDELKNGSWWAASMVDASAKLQSGILEGNFIQLGNFDECMRVYDPGHNIRGRYCMATLSHSPWEKFIHAFKLPALATKMLNRFNSSYLLTMIWGICVPDGCSAEDIEALTMDFLNITKIQCQTASDAPDLTSGDYNALALLMVVFSFIVASTAYDLYLQHFEEKPAHKLFLAFSFYTNGYKLFSVSNNPNQLKFVNGIRSISLMWVILGHMYVITCIWPSSNMIDMLKFASQDISMFLIGATVSVDTFFLLSGMFVAYVFLIYEREQVKFNTFQFYAHRYLRLTPSVALLILINNTLIRHLGSGPLWQVGTYKDVEFCEKYWWSSLLYIQNWINPGQTCLAVTWYLSVDTQLFFLSPLLLIPLSKYTNWTLSAAGILACASTLAGFYISWVNELQAFTGPNTERTKEYEIKYYRQTYTRAAPWLIGIILGYVVFNAKYVHKPVIINKFLVVLLWAASLAILFVCVFSGHSLIFDDDYNRFIQSLYISFVRPAWAIALCWVIYACEFGYGGAITKFLSLPVFEFLGKISYSMFLLHVSVFEIFLMSFRTTNTFSNYTALYYFWGHYVVIAALSTIWTLSFESPVIVLQNYLLAKDAAKAANDTKTLKQPEEILKEIATIKSHYVKNVS